MKISDKTIAQPSPYTYEYSGSIFFHHILFCQVNILAEVQASSNAIDVSPREFIRIFDLPEFHCSL